AKTSVQQVVAAFAVELIDPGIAIEPVAELGAHDILDPGQNVVLCIIPPPLARRKIDPHRTEIARIVRRVRPGATIKKVPAKTSVQQVVAAFAVELIDPGIAIEPVAELGAHDILDPGQNAAL